VTRTRGAPRAEGGTPSCRTSTPSMVRSVHRTAHTSEDHRDVHQLLRRSVVCFRRFTGIESVLPYLIEKYHPADQIARRSSGLDKWLSRLPSEGRAHQARITCTSKKNSVEDKAASESYNTTVPRLRSKCDHRHRICSEARCLSCALWVTDSVETSHLKLHFPSHALLTRPLHEQM
jgi:hypothetical protein